MKLYEAKTSLYFRLLRERSRPDEKGIETVAAAVVKTNPVRVVGALPPR